MPEHYTKATSEASIWCNACRKMTMWRILVGKRAYCIPCHDMRPPSRREKVLPPAPDRQMDLFEPGKGEKLAGN